MSDLRKAAQAVVDLWYVGAIGDVDIETLRAALAQQDRASHRTVTYACPVCAASLERQE